MAARYWVGGTSTWDTTAGTKWAATSGGTGGQAVPTSADDVFFDANSTGTCTITASTAVTCQSLDLTGSAAVLSHGAAAILNIGGTIAGPGNKALVLATGKYTWGASSTISFVSTNATQQTITTNGVTVPNVAFNGLGGSWKIIGNISCGGTATVTFIAGSVDWNGAVGSWGIWQRTGSTTCSLTLGAADITLLTGATWNFTGTTGFTFSGASATIRMTGTTQSFVGGSYTYGTLVVSSSVSCTISNTGTFGTLTYTPGAVNTSSLMLASNITVSGTFTATGNSLNLRALVQSSTVGTARTLSAAAISLSNVDFMDTTAVGLPSNAAWTGTSLGDCQGNSNITFTSPITRYAIVSGNYGSTTMWSTSSGGLGGASVPLPQDTVIFDANTPAGTYTINEPRIGKDISLTGFTGTFAVTSLAVSMYGNLVLGSGMTFTQTQTLTFRGRSTQTITSNGNAFPSSVVIDAPTGSYTLQDDISVGGATGTLQSLNGDFNANGFNVTTGRVDFVSTTVRTITFGTGTWSLVAITPGAGLLYAAGATGLIISAASATIVVTAASTSTRGFNGGNKTYGTLTYTVAGSTGPLTITGANTFANINFSDATNTRTLTLPASTTTTITGNFNVNGTAGQLMTINSSTGGTAATLAKSTGIVICDYLSIQDSKAGGGATWYAGSNSANVSNNTGWVFTAPPAGRGGFLPYFQ